MKIKIFKQKIFISARNPSLGTAALEQLKKEVDSASHSRVHFHQLDITDKQSCNTFAQYLKQKYGGLDVLINNAGIAFKVVIIFHWIGTMRCERTIYCSSKTAYKDENNESLNLLIQNSSECRN